MLKYVDPEDSLPAKGEADERVMGYSYRLCITSSPGQFVPFPTPDDYNPEDWELLRRMWD